MPALTTKPCESTRALHCMEVWGGHEAMCDAISVRGIDAWIASYPCKGAAEGGDIHYVSMCGGGEIARFVVADVSGHGVMAGALADRLRALMRKYINTPDLTRLARSLNHEFLALAQGDRFATALLTTFFVPTNHFLICNIGHPRPLWYHARSRTWALLTPDRTPRSGRGRNLPLGIVEPADYAQFAVRLGKGDLVLLYTDALMESSNAEGDRLGEWGLLGLVRSLGSVPPAAMLTAVLDAVTAYRSGAPADDDETLLVLHRNGADPPERPQGEGARMMARMFGGSNGDDAHGN